MFTIAARPMSTLKYLAYGSNLHPVRMKNRVPSARIVGLVELSGWSLVFHKRGADGSAKCNLLYTGNAADSVHAVVYEIAVDERPQLDKVEGAGYVHHHLELEQHGETFFYVAEETHVDDSLSPYTWYRDYVVEGARHHGLPDHYIDAIEQVAAIIDPDACRHLEHVRTVANAIEY